MSDDFECVFRLQARHVEVNWWTSPKLHVQHGQCITGRQHQLLLMRQLLQDEWDLQPPI